MKASTGLTLTLLVTMLSGCSVYGIMPGSGPARPPAPSYPSYPSEPEPEPEPDTLPPDSGAPSSAPVVVPPESRSPEPDTGSSANDSLVGRANAAVAEGNYERALALLERAQRIDPTDASIYLALARTYTAKGDTGRAKTTAERGLLYCRSSAQCDQLRAYTN